MKFYHSRLNGTPVSIREKTLVALGAVALAALLAGSLLSACATVGREFPSGKVSEIQIGKTTQAEIEAMFGKPWRTGIEDGYVTWTYGKYHYSAFSQTQTKDLVVRFDNNKVVRSYTFNTTADKK
jgi:outer membrane protein assembly factor BamE (lipoprotein component of BamABCDE complex)